MPRVTLGGVLKAVCAASLAAAPNALAEPAPLALHVEPGATCLEAARLTESLTAWLEQMPPRERAQAEVVGSDIDPRGVEVFVRHTNGLRSQRTFAPGPERCDDLHHATALAIALLLRQADPGALPPDPPPSEPQPEPPSAPPAAVRAAPSPAPAADPPVRSPASPGVSALAMLGRNLGAPLAPGFGVEGALRFAHHAELRAGFVSLYGQPEALAPSQAQYRTQLQAGSASLCAHGVLATRARARFCGTLVAGRLHARGAGFEETIHSRALWLALSMGPGLTVALAHGLGVEGSLALALALTKARIGAFDTRDDAYFEASLPSVGILLGLGMTWQKPRAVPR